MKNDKGFTLIELLAVVVIMAIILGISIPAVTSIQKRLVSQRVTTFFRVVEESADAYIEQYSADFDQNTNCFEITYSDLIEEELLNEDDITCLSEAYGGNKGTVLARRVNDGNTFTYEYNLSCYDKETNKRIYSDSINTDNCLGVNGGYFITVTPYLIKDGNKTVYDGEWTRGKIEYDVNVYNPYFYNIKNIQYKETGSYEWKNDKTTITDSSANGKGKVVFETSTYYNTSIKIRSVDVNNNISGEKGVYSIKVDNVKPVVTIHDSMNGNWRNISNNPAITFTTNDIPSGLKNYCIDLDSNNTCDVTLTDVVNPSYTFSTSYNGTIRVRAESNVGIKSDWATAVIKVDLIAPTCVSSGGGDNWVNTDVTILGTCSDTGGSLCKENVSHKYTTNTNGSYSPGDVYDNAGNSAHCDNRTVKIDKTPPTCSFTATTNESSNGVSLNVNCSDEGGSLCNSASQNLTGSGLKADKTYTVKDNANNEGTCTAKIANHKVSEGVHVHYYSAGTAVYGGLYTCQYYACDTNSWLSGTTCYTNQTVDTSSVHTIVNAGACYMGECDPLCRSEGYRDSICIDTTENYTYHCMCSGRYICPNGWNGPRSGLCYRGASPTNQAYSCNERQSCPSGQSYVTNTCYVSYYNCPSGTYEWDGGCYYNTTCNLNTCDQWQCSCPTKYYLNN